MFLAPRFAVTDNELGDLRAIQEAFRLLGTPCAGIHYTEVGIEDGHLLRGVRVLFMDVHLVEGSAPEEHNAHFSTIAGILEDHIRPEGGPFVLIVWTARPALKPALERYLDDHLDPEKPYVRPLALLTLPKEGFIAQGGGLLPGRQDELREAVEARVREVPQVAALLAWEAEVSRASADTLKSLVGLVDEADRRLARYAEELDTVLSTLARAAVGRNNVAADARRAVNAALAPMLFDRIVHGEVEQATRDIWNQAVTCAAAAPPLNVDKAGRVNRMLHLAFRPAESIEPCDWGAVSQLPLDWDDRELSNRFGAAGREMLGGVFCLPAGPAREGARLCLVRVGAPCDHAQRRSGPTPFLLAVLFNANVERERVTAAEWLSPPLMLDGEGEAVRLAVNIRFLWSAPAENVAALRPIFRVREQMLMSLINHGSTYLSRPGFVRLPE